MGIFYILTLIVLIVEFMLFKKSEEKQNFIKWLIISLVSIFGYNILLGMILGLLNITAYLWLLESINLLVAIAIGMKYVKTKEYQKYYVTKLDIIGIIVILVIFGVMFVKDLYIYNGDIVHGAVDSAVHYRAAKHYAENLKIFINVEDKTFFDFNIMQTGAYINDGIFMKVINEITGIDHCYLYQAFETIVLFLSGLAFYACFIDKIKTKRGLLGSLILFALYIYGFPYNSWIYGFSYLSVGIMLATILIPVVQMLYSKDNLSKKVIIPLIIILAFGVIFSYSLFVPAVFAAICIYCFLKDFSAEGKSYLKIFKKTTLIVTGLLLLVTVAGIGYLFIPSFFIEGQTDLVSALKIGGGIYSEKYNNFLVFIPFGIMFLFDLIKKIKNRELEYQDVFSIITYAYLFVAMIGFKIDLVSEYYMMKIHYLVWIALGCMTVDMINKYVDEKNIRIDVILLGLLYAALIFRGTSIGTIVKIFAAIFLVFYAVLGDLIKNFKINLFAVISVYIIYRLAIGVDFNSLSKLYLFAFLVGYTVLPELMKKIDLSKVKELFDRITKKINLKTICISGWLYITIWGVFVSGWVWIKAGHVIGEIEKHALPNFVGIYYSENCDFRKGIDLRHNFNSNLVELTTYARENVEDLNGDNILIIAPESQYFMRMWATAMMEISTDRIPYQNFTQNNAVYSIEDALENPEKKYIVKIVSHEQQSLNAHTEEFKEVEKRDDIEILFKNENGYVAKVKGR